MFKIFTVFYFISILIPTFWFKFWNLIYSSNTFTKKKLWYPGPQLLRQFKFLNFHHVVQLTATHYIVCYYIVCLRIQHPRPRCTIPWLCCIICCHLCCYHPGICGKGGWENLDTGHGTWERAEVVGEVFRGVGATENHPHPPPHPQPIGGETLFGLTIWA